MRSEMRRDLRREDVALPRARTSQPNPLDQHLLRRTNVLGFFGFLERWRGVVRFLAQLDVFVDARS